MVIFFLFFLPCFCVHFILKYNIVFFLSFFSVFETGVNWGRVLALLGFGYRLAVHVWENGRHRFLRTIAQWLARYLVESRIVRWIVGQGGWVSKQKKYILDSMCIASFSLYSYSKN